MISSRIPFVQNLKSCKKSLKSWEHVLNSLIIFHLECFIFPNQGKSLGFFDLGVPFVSHPQRIKYGLCSIFIGDIFILNVWNGVQQDSSIFVMIFIIFFVVVLSSLFFLLYCHLHPQGVCSHQLPYSIDQYLDLERSFIFYLSNNQIYLYRRRFNAIMISIIYRSSWWGKSSHFVSHWIFV